MATKSREEMLRELNRRKNYIDKGEEFRKKAAENYEKKPKALRKFDRYSSMGEKRSNNEE